jgi:hypothetical protein
MLLMIHISLTIIVRNSVHNFFVCILWALLDSQYKMYGSYQGQTLTFCGPKLFPVQKA